MNAEFALLHNIMHNNELIHEIGDLSEHDFTDGQLREVFATMQKLGRKDKPIDLITLTDLGVDMTLASNIADAFVPSSGFHEHLAVMIKQSQKRKMRMLAAELVNAAAGDEIDEALDDIESKALAIRRTEEKEYISTQEMASKILKRYNELILKPAERKGVPTGFRALDHVTLGWQRTKLYYIAAKSGGGKTSFLLQTATHAARKGHCVLFFSMEMSKEQIIIRLMSQMARVTSTSLELGRDRVFNKGMVLDRVPTSDEQKAVGLATDYIQDMNMIIEDTSAVTLEQMRAIIRKWNRRQKVDLICVDYIGLMGGKGDSMRMIMERNSKGLKDIARDFDVPVISLAQLTKEADRRENKRPVLSDLRETSGIEHDADMVAFIYRESMYNRTDENKGVAEVAIAKNRDGRLMTIELGWDEETTSFKE